MGTLNEVLVEPPKVLSLVLEEQEPSAVVG
jgi:hypothetical protein